MKAQAQRLVAVKLFNKLAMPVLFGLSMGSVSLSSYAANICANCYWGTTCGSISTKDVVDLGLVNDNPGLASNDQGPFLRFACDNGRTQLGVLWTDGDCNSIGGLSGLSSEQFPISSDPSCKFGRPNKNSNTNRGTRGRRFIK